MRSQRLKSRTALFVTAMVMTLGMIGPVFALDHFWTGAVSTDAADPLNWDNGTATPTLPSDGDIVRIGITSTWADHVPENQPVLTSEWDGREGGPGAGWWFVLGVGNQNSLTIGDGAYIEWSHNDCNLRNGGILRVIGRRNDGGPSLVIAPRFRMGNNGDSIPTATGTLIVEKNGYLQFNPLVSRKGSGGWQIYMGTLANALIEIRDDGILELAENNAVVPRFVFGSADPSANRIVISGDGQLLLAGDPSAIAQVDGTDTALQSLIDMGLITSANPDETLEFSGVNPTVVKLASRRISNPSPADGESDVDRDVILRWNASTTADKYDVYLGTDVAVVDEATRANPMDVLVSQEQAQTYYPLDGMLTLEYGRTYYWRVDEVNDLSDPAILKGRIWSFTCEPYAIPIPAQSIAATASSSRSQDQGPEKTINRSGLDANDLHSDVSTDMWLSDTSTPVWIEYEFDRMYKIRQMQVWNYNAEEFLTGLGLKDVTIEYSTDGVDWTPLSGVPVFEQAPGTANYAANTVVDFGDVVAKKVRITVNSNWADNPAFNVYGLSEVQFLYVPVVARQPSPASGASDVDLSVVLSWRAGREAATHQVHFDTDSSTVADGTALVDTVAAATYSVGDLDLGTTYYWRIDEVNDAATPSVWEGPVWDFTTAEYLVVEDFEGYTGDEGQEIFLAWVDGYGIDTNGSQAGHDLPPYVEQAVRHGGAQSMPFYYGKEMASQSEVSRTFETAQDWSRSGINTLTLYVQGQADNVAGQLTVKVNGVAKAVQVDFAAESWQEVNIDLASLGVNLQGVTSLALSIESTGSGMVLVDDIWLRR